jgi:6-pyruvoyl tetrahydropterin synthase/QueD family protein
MEISKSFKAESAHRVINSYTTKCQGLHGHSYVFTCVFSGVVQPDSGVVLDFTYIKHRIQTVIDALDHALFIYSQDTDLVLAKEMLNPRWIVFPFQSTAENLSIFLFYLVYSMNLPISKVIVQETATSQAICSGLEPVSWSITDVLYSPVLQTLLQSAKIPHDTMA